MRGGIDIVKGHSTVSTQSPTQGSGGTISATHLKDRLEATDSLIEPSGLVQIASAVSTAVTVALSPSSSVSTLPPARPQRAASVKKDRPPKPALDPQNVVESKLRSGRGATDVKRSTSVLRSKSRKDMVKQEPEGEDAVMTDAPMNYHATRSFSPISQSANSPTASTSSSPRSATLPKHASTGSLSSYNRNATSHHPSTIPSKRSVDASRDAVIAPPQKLTRKSNSHLSGFQFPQNPRSGGSGGHSGNSSSLKGSNRHHNNHRNSYDSSLPSTTAAWGGVNNQWQPQVFGATHDSMNIPGAYAAQVPPRHHKASGDKNSEKNRRPSHLWRYRDRIHVSLTMSLRHL
ncbi:hypothetical protein M427DRAFT_162918 [Gonapodya prolifera JEL478]|uniref:Uncharacterized protein n=1 Tax=Gonapodya prolifera (strain JEL478) TaxID=1344416 RepID=A0A139AZ67_GONPJ|nr:hypothetical protein M427DRAFT_162918 [Gonapodya prolifera JEL478]|eukprot:KXS22052.1 hypothetical protein M427DRAFT_162918 [Gonapodya prolifera JEL478]